VVLSGGGRGQGGNRVVGGGRWVQQAGEGCGKRACIGKGGGGGGVGGGARRKMYGRGEGGVKSTRTRLGGKEGGSMVLKRKHRYCNCIPISSSIKTENSEDLLSGRGENPRNLDKKKGSNLKEGRRSLEEILLLAKN